MIPPSRTPDGNSRSRLDPQPVARRDFLGLAALWSALAAALFATIGSARLPRVAVLPSPSRKFKVRLPESLAPGAAHVPAGRSVALFRDDGGVYAISIVCTHLGCIVKPVDSGFDCPCHGSKFGADGEVVRGPAPKGLDWLAVAPVGEDEYVVDEGAIVPPGTKEPA